MAIILSSSSLKFHSIPEPLAKRIPQTYPIPTIRIGRLARDVNFPGVGQELLANALKRIVKLSQTIGIRGIEIDAKDENAIIFYQKFGFIPLKDDKECLFLPIKTIEKIKI